MQVYVCNSYDEVSDKAAKLIASQVTLKPNCILGLATGSTPIGLYERLGKMYADGELDFSEVKTFNLDEYYPISHDNDQSYHYFMNSNLFSKVNIKPENIHIPDGECADPEAECKAYDAAIEASEGVDIQILGIGQNGHIGFNEPGRNLVAGTHLTGLTESTIKANSRFFETEQDVPKKALTMGISTILKSKKIILMACGASKADAVKALFDENINTDIPATLLKVHPDVVLICDKEALGQA